MGARHVVKLIIYENIKKSFDIAFIILYVAILMVGQLLIAWNLIKEHAREGYIFCAAYLFNKWDTLISLTNFFSIQFLEELGSNLFLHGFIFYVNML